MCFFKLKSKTGKATFVFIRVKGLCSPNMDLCLLLYHFVHHIMVQTRFCLFIVHTFCINWFCFYFSVFTILPRKDHGSLTYFPDNTFA